MMLPLRPQDDDIRERIKYLKDRGWFVCHGTQVQTLGAQCEHEKRYLLSDHHPMATIIKGDLARNLAHYMIEQNHLEFTEDAISDFRVRYRVNYRVVLPRIDPMSLEYPVYIRETERLIP